MSPAKRKIASASKQALVAVIRKSQILQRRTTHPKFTAMPTRRSSCSTGADLLRTADPDRQRSRRADRSSVDAGQCRTRDPRLCRPEQLQKVHALDGVHLCPEDCEFSATKTRHREPQDFDLTATAIDFAVANGRILQRAVTSGAAQITIVSSAQGPTAPHSPEQRTVVTAASSTRISLPQRGAKPSHKIHGAPDARIVNSTAGQPDRVSTSDSVDAAFLPQGGIESVTQQGNVAYTDEQGARQTACRPGRPRRATLRPTRCYVLTGSPRVASGGMATTANAIRINRATGDAFAEGDVKSTYSELEGTAERRSAGVVVAHSCDRPQYDGPQQPRQSRSTPAMPGSGRTRTSSRRRRSSSTAITAL